MNKRFIKIGLVLTLLNAVIAVVVANTYPFTAGDAWTNTMVLSLVPCFGIWAAVVTFLANSKPNDVLGCLALILVCKVVFGAFITYAFLSVIGNEWSSLLWGAYGANLLAFIVSTPVVYLLTPTTELELRLIDHEQAA